MIGGVVFAALAGLLATALIVPALLPPARRLGLLDRPGGRRKHDKPIPAIGGLSILLALSLVAFRFLPVTPQLLGFGGATLILAIGGVADDLFRLDWRYRLAAQVAASLAMIYLADVHVDNIGEVFGFPTRPLGLLSTPVTILATVGIINAVNMADGIDGLAGMIGVAATTLLAGAALYAGNASLAVGLGLVAGALAGFLVYNLRTPWNPRARIFLGNAGSELLGFFIAAACFRLTQNAEHPVGAHIAPFILAPVLIDCLTLMVRRTRSGVSPFHGDRNHLHHLLLDAGLNTTRTMALIAGATLVIGIAAAFALKAHVPAPCFTLAFLALWAAYFQATNNREAFVSRVGALARRLGSIPPEKPLEPWQILARNAGLPYRRSSDKPEWAYAPGERPKADPEAAPDPAASAKTPGDPVTTRR